MLVFLSIREINYDCSLFKSLDLALGKLPLQSIEKAKPFLPGFDIVREPITLNQFPTIFHRLFRLDIESVTVLDRKF